MKASGRILVLLLGFFLAGAGCQSLDLTPETDPERVVAGTVSMAADEVFPPDAVLVVRVIDSASIERAKPLTGAEPPVVDRNPPTKVDRVVGEQVIRAPGTKPIPFRVEFRADDAAMRRGLNIEARISIAGKVRYRTLSGHLVTLSSVLTPQEIVVEPVR
jgi:uncharacterized lipoprotein YbaY